jgi:predicted GNAT family acetyltransferase
MIRVEIDSNLSTFLREVSPYLEKNLSIHSFLLSLATRLEDAGKPPALIARGVDEEGNLVIAGMQTESCYPLVVSMASEAHAKLFARKLSEKVSQLPGVNGPLPSANHFAEAWKAEKTCQLKTATDLRLFELTTTIPPTKPSGFARTAEPDDVDLIFYWLEDFHEEAVPHDPKPSAESLHQRIRDSVLKGYYFIWEDRGQPVCLVGSNRETSTERWVAPVYTPKELRGRGYASALVAAVSQRIVASGKKGMLFTDLSNPTSNSIYQKVGYVPLADFRHVLFQ